MILNTVNPVCPYCKATEYESREDIVFKCIKCEAVYMAVVTFEMINPPRPQKVGSNIKWSIEATGESS